jgi:hypothetical protein
MASVELWRVNSFRDRHGRMRHYFRPPGRKPIPLPGLPGSDEFMEAYRAALKECGDAAPLNLASRTIAGTLNAAIVGYYSSQDFKVELAKSTQGMRRAILEKWRLEDGEKRFAAIRSHHLVNMLAPMKPNAQKNWIKTLRGLMKFGKAANLRSDDPTQDVKVVKAGKSMGHMTWLDEHRLASIASTLCAPVRTACNHADSLDDRGPRRSKLNGHERTRRNAGN